MTRKAAFEKSPARDAPEARRGEEAVPVAGGSGGCGAPRRSAFLRWGRVVVTSLLLLVLLQATPFDELAAALQTASRNWGYLLVALCLPGLGLFLSSLRWRVLLQARGDHTRLRALFEALLIGTFFNHLLPSTVGGDLARGRWIAPSGATRRGATTSSLTTVALDRALGLLGILLIALVAIACAPTTLERYSFAGLVALSMFALGAWVLLRLYRGPTLRARRALPAAPSGPSSFLRGRADVVRRTLSSYEGKGWALLLSLLLAVLLQGVIVVHLTVLGAAIEADLALSEAFVLVPLVTLVTLVPVTVNGMGVRESALAVVGAPMGLTSGDSLVLGWLFVAISLLYALAGGILYLRGKRP